MPLLSRPAAKPVPRRPRAAPPPVALVDGCVRISVAGTLVEALPEGALWIASARTLVVSDVHFEKGSAYARGGQMLPPYDTRKALTRLAALIETLKPQRVVSLGDSFHDVDAPQRMHEGDRDALMEAMARVEWVWVLGNHDPEIPDTLGGVRTRELRVESLVLRHEPVEADAPGEIAGHLHPCAKVAGRGRSVRRRCFASDGVRLVMPAFGAYAGGLNVRDEAFAPIFPNGALALVISRGRVLPAPHERLLSDA
ncbi:MAG TPA: ligase-associated DNA damage response endonuclease PdeM [Caulobacterales bacterium]|nr:ligase-associated DNA damage response endonuclease PdeM [Caulobacterales bacterium]